MKEPHVPFIIQGDCLDILQNRWNLSEQITTTFFDPPFNQGKDYWQHPDDMKAAHYWAWIKEILGAIYLKTHEGGCLFFMQREKNVEWVLKSLRETGWIFQNLLIWKKMTSAVPQKRRFGKQYQVIVFVTKGKRPKTFHRLRIDAPLAPHMKIPRKNGLYVTDVWDEIRELTAGYFAGDEALREKDNNNRLHDQQSPLALVTRMILSTTEPGDLVFDPCAGTGTTGVAALQLSRKLLLLEKDPTYAELIHHRLSKIRPSDSLDKLRDYYRFTSGLDDIWPKTKKME